MDAFAKLRSCTNLGSVISGDPHNQYFPEIQIYQYHKLVLPIFTKVWWVSTNFGPDIIISPKANFCLKSHQTNIFHKTFGLTMHVRASKNVGFWGLERHPNSLLHHFGLSGLSKKVSQEFWSTDPAVKKANLGLRSNLPRLLSRTEWPLLPDLNTLGYLVMAYLDKEPSKLSQLSLATLATSITSAWPKMSTD